jgi:hypothetical protein
MHRSCWEITHIHLYFSWVNTWQSLESFNCWEPTTFAITSQRRGRPTTFSIFFFPKSLISLLPRHDASSHRCCSPTCADAPLVRNTRRRHRIPSSRTFGLCATPDDYCLERILEVSSRPCLTDGQTGFAYFYIEVDSLSWHCAAGLRGWTWGRAMWSRPYSPTVQTLVASSRALPNSAAGIPPSPRRMGGATTDRRWTIPILRSPQPDLSQPAASTSASTPVTRHGEPLPLPLLSSARLHYGQHSSGWVAMAQACEGLYLMWRGVLARHPTAWAWPPLASTYMEPSRAGATAVGLTLARRPSSRVGQRSLGLLAKGSILVPVPFHRRALEFDRQGEGGGSSEEKNEREHEWGEIDFGALRCVHSYPMIIRSKERLIFSIFIKSLRCIGPILFWYRSHTMMVPWYRPVPSVWYYLFYHR